MSNRRVSVIGSGFAGLSAATTLADQGFEVTLLEKNSVPGGRARYFEAEGFMFDMGPSWYWMPDVFERYFARFGKKPSDYYDLIRLDPSYTVVFDKDEFVDLPAKMEELEALFERYEPGSAAQLREFLKVAAYKYEVGINQLVYKPSRSLTEFVDPKLLYDMVRMNIFQSIYKHIRHYFKNDKLIRLMEFPVLFLGAIPENTPALYSIMNYADMALGTWYPKGGMHQIVKGMVALAEEKGVKLKLDAEVAGFGFSGKNIQSIKLRNGEELATDIVVAGADYHHVESVLLPPEKRNYSESYWDKRVMAPSSLLYYVGVGKRLENLHHHNLFFDEDLRPHAREIYEDPQWPKKPLFYACVPSITDPTVAPEGHENLFLLIPTAPGLHDSEAIKEKYFNIVMDRLENLTGQSIKEHIVYKRSYAHSDFINDYHAFKGNAYGLANTLMQTAILKPALKNKKVKNLYYTGQLTVPGPGVPPSLISGQVVAGEVIKDLG